MRERLWGRRGVGHLDSLKQYLHISVLDSTKRDMLINASYICKRSSFKSGCCQQHVPCQNDGRLGTYVESLFWITREHSGLELSSFRFLFFFLVFFCFVFFIPL